MGDGGLTASSFDAFYPAPASGGSSSWGDLIAANDARLNGLQNVDMGTALLAKLATPEGKVLAAGVVVAMALLLIPSPSAGGRRR